MARAPCMAFFAVAALAGGAGLADAILLPGHPAPSVAPTVLEEGWNVTKVASNLKFPSSLAWRGDELLVLEQGRYVYAQPYTGQEKGQLRAFALAPGGGFAGSRIAATRLADPMGVAVDAAGDVWISEFRGLARIPAPAFEGGPSQPVLHSWGYPTQTPDATYLPVTGMHINAIVGDPIAGETTGPMGIAFGPTGQPYVTTAGHGRPPDDDGVRDVTGLDYDNPYSSSILAPLGGPLAPDQVAARACRNCFDLAFAPPGTPFAGQLFVTENVGIYRARLFAGSDRSVLAGSTATDWNVLDGVNAVDLEAGTMRRAATFRPDGLLLGASPTGIAFAPASWERHPGAMLVALFSGFAPATDDRGEIAIVQPDPEDGLGTAAPFVLALDFPTDLAVGPDGALYVLEYFRGDLWRIAPE